VATNKLKLTEATTLPELPNTVAEHIVPFTTMLFSAAVPVIDIVWYVHEVSHEPVTVMPFVDVHDKSFLKKNVV